MPDYLILGCGYTAGRVARTLVAAGQRVICTNRQVAGIPGATNVTLDVEDPVSVDRLASQLSKDLRVLNSISSTNGTTHLLETLQRFGPKRMLYISTTGVYGAAEFVDEHTIPVPDSVRDELRLATENLIASGPWQSLILRPAAIYGPGRGVHTSAHSGVFRPPPGGNRIISRIHVDDLAQHVLAGLQTELTGAFPIADEEPCPSLTVAALAFHLLNVPLKTEDREPTLRDERKSGRRVDGSAYRRILGLPLRYPTYREGVPACLEAEGPSPR